MEFFKFVPTLKASKGKASSFVWSGIWSAKEELTKGFRWVLGSGDSIVATKDPWLRNKGNFQVEQSPFYEGRNEVVSSLFLPNEKKWNALLIRNQFLTEDADAILALHIPQRAVADKVVWTASSNGIYTAKAAYHFWYESKFGTNIIPQCMGWKKIWHLRLPHKIRVFIWRFCRNTIPVRTRLNSRGINIPTTCPMCVNGIEHMSHLFYECDFAKGCWNHAGLVYDWSEVEGAQDWVLHKLNTATSEELVKIFVVIWGIWYWRNKRVWDGKVVTPDFAMNNSFQRYSEWIEARKCQVNVNPNHSSTNETSKKSESKWQPPASGKFKINVDASVFSGAQNYSVGMVLRNHEGTFLAGKNHCFSGEVSVLEAEAVGVREALSWIKDMRMQGDEVTVESDSQLTIKAILGNKLNFLEVGEVIESCKLILGSLHKVSVMFIRKTANKVAHEAARIHCLVNSRNLFTSPPTCLLEALLHDRLF